MKTVLQIALGIILAVLVLGAIGFGVYVASQPSELEKQQIASQQVLDRLHDIDKQTCERLAELNPDEGKKCFAEMNQPITTNNNEGHAKTKVSVSQ